LGEDVVPIGAVMLTALASQLSVTVVFDPRRHRVLVKGGLS